MERVSLSDDVQVLVEQLRSQHAQLDARLHELEHHISLTAEEQLEIARLKKLKLATKDRIALITSRKSGSA
jgi:hypothetical protein